jgi:hypothetical protein
MVLRIRAPEGNPELCNSAKNKVPAPGGSEGWHQFHQPQHSERDLADMASHSAPAIIVPWVMTPDPPSVFKVFAKNPKIFSMGVEMAALAGGRRRKSPCATGKNGAFWRHGSAFFPHRNWL